MSDAAAAPASPPLAIAVIGLGGIGSTFAFQLAQAGHDVTVVARPASPRLAQLQRDGGVVDHTGQGAATRVADALDEAKPYDLVIVTTLAHQVDAVLPALTRSAAKAIHFMFNTFEPERLGDAVGPGRASFGMPFVAATVNKAGRLHATITATRKTLHGDRRWTDLFNAAGIPSAFDADMPLWLRNHAPMCIAMEAISFLGQRRGSGASWSEAATTARGVRAGYAIIRALGHAIYPKSKVTLAGLPTPALAAMLWAVSRVRSFRDLLATGVGECRALADTLADAAAGKPELSDAARAVLAMKPA